MPVVFDLAFLFFSIFYLPVFLVKSRQAENPRELIRQRFGFLPKELSSLLRRKKLVWLHAVSVGEAMAVQGFVEKFLERYPDLHLLLTTVTPTGQKVVRKMEGPRVSTAYFPFDFSFSVRRFFDALKPACLLLAETEMWPNLLLCASERKVPVIILNGRLSPKSAAGYRRFKAIFRPLFEKLTMVLAQTEADAERFRNAGVAPEKAAVTGNIKFDNFEINTERETIDREIRSMRRIPEETPVWVVGSTHPGEEEIILSVLLRLLKEQTALKLFLAPRHIERSADIQALASAKGLKPVLSAGPPPEASYDVLIINEIGVLKKLYASADVVFMGGSLVKKGGQNPIEPASFKRAIIHGTHVFNFQQVYRLLDEEGGAIAVQNEDQLYSAVKRILEDNDERTACGERAYQAVCSMRGATVRTLEFLDIFFPQQGVFAKG